MAGIGNIFLGDDGFGPEVLRRISPTYPDGLLSQSAPGDRVRLTDYGTRGVHLAYDLLDGWDELVLVDALPAQGSPGRVHIFEADHETPCRSASLDAHAMDPNAVFASLVALGGTPPPTVVVGCEVSCVDERLGLSDAVAAAVPGAVRAVETVVAQLLAKPALRGG